MPELLLEEGLPEELLEPLSELPDDALLPVLEPEAEPPGDGVAASVPYAPLCVFFATVVRSCNGEFAHAPSNSAAAIPTAHSLRIMIDSPH
ncbi:MAG: hypothetical protein ACM3X5_05705 [Bacillota bacterium]